MKRKILIALIVVGLFLAIYFAGQKNQEEIARIGWQPPWINQGQIAAILQKTDILEKNGIKAQFYSFSFGPPMTEAALSGNLDILFLGDQPAFNLIAKDDSWKIVAPLVHYKSAILIPTDSDVNKITDLKGKVIATGVGSTTYRDTLSLLQKEGIKQDEVKITNLDVGEQLAFMQTRQNSWEGLDAIAAYDPTVTIAVSKKLAKPLKEYGSLGVIAMNKKYYEKNPEQAQKFLESVKQAFEYYNKNKDQVNDWYADLSKYSADKDLFYKMASIEPTMQGAEVKAYFDENALGELQEHLSTALQLGLIKKEMKIEDIVVNLNKYHNQN